MLLKILWLHTVRRAIPYLPHAAQMALGWLCGAVQARTAKARVIRQELAAMLGGRVPDADLDVLAIRSMADYDRDLFEIWSFPRLTPEKCARLCALQGRERLDQALGLGRGVVVGVTHFGSWKMLIAALAYAGYPVNQIAVDPLSFAGPDRPRHHNMVMALERRCEDSLPARFIYVGGMMRDVIRAFRSNELVLDSFDGLGPARKIACRLLDATVPIDTGPFALALRMNAPLLPCFAVRRDDLRHDIVIHEPIRFPETDDREAQIQAGLAQYLRIFEAHALARPSHYGRILYELARSRGATS